MNRLRQIALFAAALFPGLLACAQGLPETTVNWETEVVTGEDGTSRIVFTGTPVVPLDQVHGTLQWISCVGESCHSPEEIEYDLHPIAAKGAAEGLSPSGVRPSDSPHHPSGTVPPLSNRGCYVPQGEYPAPGHPSRDRSCKPKWEDY